MTIKIIGPLAELRLQQSLREIGILDNSEKLVALRDAHFGNRMIGVSERLENLMTVIGTAIFLSKFEKL